MKNSKKIWLALLVLALSDFCLTLLTSLEIIPNVVYLRPKDNHELVISLLLPIEITLGLIMACYALKVYDHKKWNLILYSLLFSLGYAQLLWLPYNIATAAFNFGALLACALKYGN